MSNSKDNEIDPIAGIGFGLLGSVLWAYIGASIIDTYKFDVITGAVFMFVWMLAFVLFVLKISK